MGRGSVDAIQMPADTVAMPSTRFGPIGSPTMIAARAAALIGLTVMVFATRVGVVRSGA